MLAPSRELSAKRVKTEFTSGIMRRVMLEIKSAVLVESCSMPQGMYRVRSRRRWGVWVTGVGEFTNVDSTDNAAGYYLQTGGVTVGVDYRVFPFFAIGFTGGYAHTNADLANGGNIEVNNGTLGLYATAFENGFYLDTAVTGGPSGYNTRRTALLGSANGNTGGGGLNVLVAAGYEWKKGGLSIGPTANFQFTYVGFSAFTESGSLAPLRFPDQNSESERTAFGAGAEAGEQFRWLC
jgi:outer membrane autotransporter protein